MFYIAPALLSLCVVQAVMAAVLMTFWKMRKSAPGLPEMASAMAISSIGALLMGISTSQEKVIAGYAGIQCFVIGLLLTARAMRRLLGLKPLRGFEAAAFLSCALGDIYFLFIDKNLTNVAILHSAVYTVICLVTLLALLRESRTDLKPGCRILAFTFAIFGIASMVRVGVRIFFDIPVPVNIEVASLELVYIFVGIATSIGWTIAYVWTTYSVAEHRLRVANDKLERFTGAVAHDLNMPLNAIIGYLSAIAHLPAGQEHRRDEFISTANEASRRMSRFIQDLLEQSRDGHENNAPERVDTAACIQEALHPLRHRIEQTDTDVHIDVNHHVLATAFQITRVFQNLFDNAIKYRDEARPLKIHVTSVREDVWISLSIRDNGLGISIEDQSRIFGAFERANSKSALPGHGLGLSECKRIVESFGGKITVNSSLSEGTVFTLRLPAVRS